jgi:hypothetical protein
MAEVVSGGAGKMQRMELSSYARGSKTAEAAMDLAKTDQVQNGGYKGRD